MKHVPSHNLNLRQPQVGDLVIAVSPSEDSMTGYMYLIVAIMPSMMANQMVYHYYVIYANGLTGFGKVNSVPRCLVSYNELLIPAL